MNRLDVLAAQFVKQRPDCIRLLVRLARKRKAAGERRLSVKALFEEARPIVRKMGKRSRGGPWALDNSLTSRVARILVRSHADLKGCFEFRALAGER